MGQSTRTVMGVPLIKIDCVTVATSRPETPTVPIAPLGPCGPVGPRSPVHVASTSARPATPITPRSRLLMRPPLLSLSVAVPCVPLDSGQSRADARVPKQQVRERLAPDARLLERFRDHLGMQEATRAKLGLHRLESVRAAACHSRPRFLKRELRRVGARI